DFYCQVWDSRSDRYIF
nr:immunoglobulin light chain junction region [Macaca mulatta]